MEVVSWIFRRPNMNLLSSFSLFLHVAKLLLKDIT